MPRGGWWLSLEGSLSQEVGAGPGGLPGQGRDRGQARTRAGRGSALLTMKAYENAPSTAKHETTSRGTTNDPVRSARKPTRMGLPMPARFEAKFWMPPTEATWLSLGATSAGSDQIPDAAKARLE